jgi:hypothetical protein
MLPVNIDISDVIEEFSILEDEIPILKANILSKVVNTFSATWEQLIGQRLHGTRSEYLRAIYREQPDQNTVIIGLTSRQSQLALMIEDGSAPFDEKAGFEKSDKKTMKKDGGWYLTIPLRWATPDAIGEASVFSNKMPEEVYAVAKELPPKQALQVGQLPDFLQGKKIRAALPGFAAYEHRNNLFESMTRNEDVRGRGNYMTFRRVSDKSDPAAFIHPGFTAYNLMDAALEAMDVGTVVDMATDDWLNAR